METNAALDFEVLTAGVHVRLVPISERALDWYWYRSQPEEWPYFHVRRYGDTPFGWFLGELDDGFDRLVARLQADHFELGALADD